MHDLRLRTGHRIELVDITESVNEVVSKAGLREGLCNIFTPHTTTAVIVSENWDPDVKSDLLRHLEKLVPQDAGYRHGEGNSQAHILSVMLGVSLNVPVSDGRLSLGRWQGVLMAELDGPRERSLFVTLIPQA